MEPTAPTPSMRAALLALIPEVRALEQSYIASLSDAERRATGHPDAWAAKDDLIHLASWQQIAAGRVEAAATSVQPPQVEEYEQYNARRFEETRHLPWDEVVRQAFAALDALEFALQKVSDEDLIEPGRYSWMNGRSLYTTILGNLYEHPVEHIAAYLDTQGQPARAEALRHEMLATTERLFGRGVEYGNAVYNLGCFYARAGQPERAIPLIRESLTINPGLTDWSRQDADLDSLRALPDFQAIYG